MRTTFTAILADGATFTPTMYHVFGIQPDQTEGHVKVSLTEDIETAEQFGDALKRLLGMVPSLPNDGKPKGMTVGFLRLGPEGGMPSESFAGLETNSLEGWVKEQLNQIEPLFAGWWEQLLERREESFRLAQENPDALTLH